MLTVFLMKSPCFFGIGVKWMVPILDFSACLGLIFITLTVVTHGQDTAVPAFVPTGVCLGWFAPAAAAPGSPLPKCLGSFPTLRSSAGFLYTHTHKIRQTLELYSQIFTGLISCGQLLHFSEPISLPAKQIRYSNLSHGIVRQGVKGVWNIRSAPLLLPQLFFQGFKKLLKIAHFLTCKVHSSNGRTKISVGCEEQPSPEQ